MQEGQELLARAHGEMRRRMRHDVRVPAPPVRAGGEVEAHREAARVGVGVRVRDLGDAGGGAEARDDGRGGRVEVRRGAQLRGFGRRGEGSAEHEAAGVGGAEAGVVAKDLFEGGDQLFGRGDSRFVFWERHCGRRVRVLDWERFQP